MVVDTAEKIGALTGTPMSPKQVIQVILLAPLEIPVMLWGDTGIGKSMIVEEIAHLLGIPYMVTIAQVTSPVDWMGIPVIERPKNGGRPFTTFTHPNILPMDSDGPRGVYLFDELPNAPKSVQAAIQTLLTRGIYNGYRWPLGWKQIIAGNRAGDRAMTYEMPRPVANRMMHLWVRADVDDWQEWAGSSLISELVDEVGSHTFFPSIKEMRKETDSRVHPMVRAYLKHRPDAFVLPDGEHTEIETFPTPRTWEYVGHIVRLENIPETMQYLMVEGLIGAGATSEFMSYLKDTSILPNPTELLDGTVKLVRKVGEGGREQTFLPIDDTLRPLESSQLYAVACGLASAYKEEKQLKNFFHCIEAMDSEFGVLSVNELSHRSPEVVRCKDFFEWTEKSEAEVLREG